MNRDRPQPGDGDAAPKAADKKTVLLVDVNSETRDSRTRVMETLGVTVHCASSAGAARAKLQSGAYNLVLLDLGRDIEGAEALAQEIRGKNSRQLVAFLVGRPLYVATSLNGKAARPARMLPVRTAPALPTTNTPAKDFDFAQKIKQAQAEDVA